MHEYSNQQSAIHQQYCKTEIVSEDDFCNQADCRIFAWHIIRHFRTIDLLITTNALILEFSAHT